MKIVDVKPYSPLYGAIWPGARLVTVNGHPVADELEFHFHNTEDYLDLEIEVDGATREFSLDAEACGDLGLTFEDAKIRICNNKCIFCFVHQQPKGMRRSLYVRDDDFRLSFTHGNYISLSAMSEDDYRRIIEQRLSPLYISVHATDDTLRRCIFKNEKLEPILPRLKELTGNGIAIHTQAVVCPEVNDGDHLRQTIEDLAELAPGVASLAVVPVGLTKYRQKLPELRPFTSDEAATTIDLVHGYHQGFRNRFGTRFAFPADEFFLQAGRELPSLSYYEEMAQFENGVGMCRQLITDFNRRKRFLPERVARPLRLGLITGASAAPVLEEFILPSLHKIDNLTIDLTVVENEFWGEMVTVTGLLTGQDILAQVGESRAEVLVLPPNCLNFDDLFLDDFSLEQFTNLAGRPVVVGSYNMVETITRAIREMQ